MPTLRVSTLLRSIAGPRRQVSQAPIASAPGYQSRTYAQGGGSYGGGEGDPKGENPQEQGSNPSAELEHPGPPPPSAGQGTGGGPTKAGESGQNTKQNDSSSGGNKDATEQKSVSGSRPKILGENDPEHSEDVKAHNEDMKKRHDRPQEGVEPDAKDNVDPKFWSGKDYASLKHCLWLTYTIRQRWSGPTAIDWCYNRSSLWYCQHTAGCSFRHSDSQVFDYGWGTLNSIVALYMMSSWAKRVLHSQGATACSPVEGSEVYHGDVTPP